MTRRSFKAVYAVRFNGRKDDRLLRGRLRTLACLQRLRADGESVLVEYLDLDRI